MKPVDVFLRKINDELKCFFPFRRGALEELTRVNPMYSSCGLWLGEALLFSWKYPPGPV
jgi:hypothetical protein